jgi:WhiB family transcriptional regulator, redox-sensing transcriptional regulator
MSHMSQRLLPHRSAPEASDWRVQAACRDVDPELFFPVSASGASVPQIEAAKQVCRTCPVCGPCLRWALEQSENAAFWGGTTEDERRNIRLLRHAV